jgi:CO dehydrogenase/acetyl-CoA synthase beta subunit
MNQFDPYIKFIASQIGEIIADGSRVRSVTVLGSPSEIIGSLPIKVGKGANRGIVLRSDTFAELGNPEAGSCAILLATSDTGLIQDGRISILGNDIQDRKPDTDKVPVIKVTRNAESTDASPSVTKPTVQTGTSVISLPFGQIVMVGGKNLTNNHFETLKTSLIIGDQIEGYMERSQSFNIWSRVSLDAAKKEFSLFTLGKALVAIIKSCNPAVEVVQVTFVTTGKQHITMLESYAMQIRKIARELVRDNWKIKGYDIECLSDCDLCNEKPICDDIREVIRNKNENATHKIKIEI